MLLGGQPFDRGNRQVLDLDRDPDGDGFAAFARRYVGYLRRKRRKVIRQRGVRRFAVHADALFVDIPLQIVEHVSSGDMVGLDAVYHELLAGAVGFGIVQVEVLPQFFGQRLKIFGLVEGQRIDLGHYEIRRTVGQEAQVRGRKHHAGFHGNLNGYGILIAAIAADVTYVFAAGRVVDHVQIPVYVYALREIRSAVVEIRVNAVGQNIEYVVDDKVTVYVEVVPDSAATARPGSAYRGEV